MTVAKDLILPVDPAEVETPFGAIGMALTPDGWAKFSRWLQKRAQTEGLWYGYDLGGKRFEVTIQEISEGLEVIVVARRTFILWSRRLLKFIPFVRGSQWHTMKLERFGLLLERGVLTTVGAIENGPAMELLISNAMETPDLVLETDEPTQVSVVLFGCGLSVSSENPLIDSDPSALPGLGEDLGDIKIQAHFPSFMDHDGPMVDRRYQTVSRPGEPGEGVDLSETTMMCPVWETDDVQADPPADADFIHIRLVARIEGIDKILNTYSGQTYFRLKVSSCGQRFELYTHEQGVEGEAPRKGMWVEGIAWVQGRVAA